jgi:tryptophan synthase alpha chain
MNILRNQLMSNRIINLFREKNKNILSVFYTAGYPGTIDTIAIAKYLEDAGADIIEIGIPFSDPVADGPTIQESNKIALDKGMNLHLLIDQIKEIRKTVNHPIILMGYLNPIIQYGVEKFVVDASSAGVDGLIIPDMPLHEFTENYKGLFKENDLCNTFLISPTTSLERIKQIDEATHGFIYAVSASSTTGARNDFSSEQLHYFDKLKNLNLKNPFLIGFGISNHASFSKASEYGSGAIVGSAFVQLLKTSSDLEGDIKQFVKNLKNSKV